MSIASRITSMENNIRNAYHGLDSIGIDTTNTNKNIENISALLEDFYDTLPKVSGTGSNIQLTPTKKGRIASQINGDTFQDGEPTPSSPVAIQSVTGLQNIPVCGKNLFNKNSVESGMYIGDVGDTINTRSNSNTFRHPIIPIGSSYITISSSDLYVAFRVKLLDKDKKIIFNQGYSSLPQTIDTSTAKYMAIFFDATTITVDADIQIEKGSTATTYEAYSGETYEINLRDIHLYESDQIIGTPDNWSIKHAKKEVILDENVAILNNSSYISIGRFNILNYLDGIAGSIGNPGAISTHFIGKYQTANGNIYISSVDRSIDIIYTDYANNVAGFKSWLGSNKPKVVYELETPTTTPITDTTLINDLNNFYYAMSKNGETNISVDGSLPIILDVSVLKGEE